MNGLRDFSKIMFLLPVGVLLYDLVKEWFVNARIRIRSLQDWWKWLDPDSVSAGRKFMGKALSPEMVSKFMALPAPIATLFIPAALYLLYLIIHTIRGGKASGGYRRD